MSLYDCIFPSIESLVPLCTAFGKTDTLTRSMLFCEQDQWATRENAEMDHRRGEVLQLEALEEGREGG